MINGSGVLGAGSSFTIAAGVVQLTPVWVFRRMSLVSIAVRLQLGGGSGNIRIGLYSNNGNTPTGGLLIYDSGNLPVTAADQTITATPPQTISLQAGIYWIAVQPQVSKDFYANQLLPNFSDLTGEAFNASTFTLPAYGPFPSKVPRVTANIGTFLINFNMRVTIPQ